MKTASELLCLLERDLIRKQDAPSGVFMTEVGSPDGKRRADALFIQGVGGKGIDGYEIKVSRSDLQTELADPHKVDSWKRFCRRWWLVVPDESILSGYDIPDDWGIKVAPTAKNRVAFTVIRPAPILEPHDLGPVIGRLATVWAYRIRDQKFETARARGEATRALEKRQEMEDRLAEHGLSLQASEDRSAARARDLLTELRKRNIWMPLPTKDNPDEFEALIDAVADVLAGQSIRDKAVDVIASKLREVKKAQEDLTASWQFKELVRILGEDLPLQERNHHAVRNSR